jgi:hypothetical protein
MKNYRFVLVSLSILTLIFSCKKEESNPLTPLTPSHSKIIQIKYVDSALVKNLTVNVFYPDSIIFNCELRDSNFSSIELLVEVPGENTDCGPSYSLETIAVEERKSYNIKFKVMYWSKKTNYFNTTYAIFYKKVDFEGRIATIIIDYD